MLSFALVTEGITDQAVLENILCGHYGEEPAINPLQPLRDATDEHRQGSFGGWEQVLEYCEHGELSEALIFNDYLIIQVDTDCAERFGVALTDGGKDRLETELIAHVKNVIISKLGDQFCRDYENQILFAISVHSLECWLLPLHADKAKDSGRTKSCAKHLERTTKAQLVKDYRTYLRLSKPYLEKSAITRGRQHNVSLDAFVASLPEA